MKKSNYNFFIDIGEDKIIAYNSLTNGLAIIEYSLFKKFKTNTLSKEEEDDFLKGGFLLEESLDELDIIRYNVQKTRCNSDFFGITIAPTLACNFKCIYCYEKDQENYKIMSDEVVNSLMHYIENKIKTVKNLDICWYGGEPLLAIDFIKKFSPQILNICKENNVKYTSGIVTNGYLLNSDICKILKECLISDIQITLDGTKKYHDDRRMLKNGSGTFDRILSNLIMLKNFDFSVSIRVNVDTDNITEFYKLIYILEENRLLNFVNPYMAMVTPINEKYNKDKCLNGFAASDIKADTYEYFSKKYSTGYTPHYPSNKYQYCCADSFQSFVIDPDGNMYKCWDDVGYVEKSFKNILTHSYNMNNEFDYILYDVTKNINCSKCNVLPICMGGCPHKRLQYTNECDDYKFNLERILKNFVKFKTKI